ncbi:MAG: argininosuccinate lyase [Armatimonadetes bacterium]|nr:argininosuccinate lyase [Armatimonadota bacterium]
MRLWDKGLPLDQKILEFTVGSDYLLDRRLVPYDILASKAHARMLGACGHLAIADVQAIVEALDQAQNDFDQGLWTVELEDEDAHTSLEKRLGELGGKVHLGRSRNDQVLTALRLYLKDVIHVVAVQIEQCQAALATLADEQGDIALPGYTHMQPAMPSCVRDWAAAFSSELGDSLQALQAPLIFLDKNPLGSAAGYGTPGLNLDREQTTHELGFRETHEPVTAPQLSRGKGEASLALGLYLILQDLGRLAADLCLYNTAEFGFVRLPAEFTTGSSIMPQKRNPDVFELVRGHSAQSVGELNAILAITAKMTSGYHRDLQLLKEPLFRLIDRTLACLDTMAHAVPRIEFIRKRTEEANDPSMHAAEKAFQLAKERNISFREAYRQVADELR